MHIKIDSFKYRKLAFFNFLIFFLKKQQFFPWCYLNSSFFKFLRKKFLLYYNNSQDIWDQLQLSCEIGHSGKSLISLFQEFFASIDKAFILAGGVGARLSFYEIQTVSRYFLISEDPKSQVVWQLVRQLVYTMFISNNRTSFDLW